MYLLQWIHSYLANRSQSVAVGGEESSMLPAVSGVPQVYCYIDIVARVSPSSKLALFADDIAFLYHSISSCSAAIGYLCLGIRKLVNSPCKKVLLYYAHYSKTFALNPSSTTLC